MAHQHKKMHWSLAFLLFIVSLPFIIAGIVFFGLIYLLTTVLPAPIELIVYKRSDFYKDLKIKYVKENPSLDFVCQSEGYYYYKGDGSVLVMPYYAEYKYEGGKWLLTMKEGGEVIEPCDVRPTFQNLIKEDISGLELKLLVKEKFFKKDQLELAKANPVFVFYKNHKDFATIKA